MAKISIQRRHLRISILIVLTIVLLAGVVSLFTHSGFKFAYYHTAVVVDLTNVEAIEFDKVAGISEVAKVDRTEKVVEFQGKSPAEVQLQIEKIVKGESLPFISIQEEIRVFPRSLGQIILFAAGYGAAAIVISLYFFVFRKFQGGGSKLIGLLITYLLTILLGSVAYLGLVSLVSTFYVLTPYSLLGIGVVWLVGLSWLFTNFLNAAQKYGDRIPSMGKFIHDTTTDVNRVGFQSAIYLMVILVGLTIALGVRMVFDGVLIFIGLAMLVAWLSILPPYLYMAVHRLPWRQPHAELGEVAHLKTKVTVVKSKVKSKPKTKRRSRR